MSREFQSRTQEPNGFAIGVPHLFNETQRHALRQAAQMAQIESPIWVDDALADAAAYAWLGPRHNEVSIPENTPWMLLHVGESTTTMLLLNSVDGKLTVLGGENDRDLGGSHWDQALVDLAAMPIEPGTARIPVSNSRQPLGYWTNAKVPNVDLIEPPK
ncbi:MAG: Hsp70 family protein [Pirellulaceae bacterium]